MIDAEPVPETLAARAASLFSAFRAGDAARMGELVALLTPILWHTVRSQRVDRDSAEDVLQTVWLALVRNADSISDPQAVLQWLIVSARREAWRVVKREDRVEPTEFEAGDLVSPAYDMPEELVLRDRCRMLLRVIAFADRPDYAAVAESLGMPIGSIGPTRGRCLAKLRLQLANDPGWES
jgi:DNA-directed RNA polymerase specialized sigma24 family protein